MTLYHCLKCGRDLPADHFSEKPNTCIACDKPRDRLHGRWHHGDGVLVCGTLRIARADFDTDPPLPFRKLVFDQIVETMNAAQEPALTEPEVRQMATIEAANTLREDGLVDSLTLKMHRPELIRRIENAIVKVALCHAADLEERLRNQDGVSTWMEYESETPPLSIVKGFEAEENECVATLLNGVPADGGSATKRNFEMLVRMAFQGGLTAQNKKTWV